jgi:N-acetylglutamate synthase-like GNAT family acetyltransferase
MNAPADRIEYSNTPADPEAYFALFETTGWNEMYRRTPEELQRTLQNSWYLVTAMHGDELVGAGRVVSDGIQYAVVFDMIVAPAWQGRGIGSEILKRLLARCDEAKIRDVLLFAASGTYEFYRRHGFARRPKDAPGMIMRRS